ncbi:expressed unknown protein [Seminavis robusta]|uniref:Peptidase A2 domain-containing protein n=1 Tax=Seminavis robusta TaxID=568900 RepID=A0A9N8H7U6_9STRA|nr:expressed unknown protein [Seminavis robusta]|eukprot:Sro140_g065300.1 n/a (407) ;mRNA; f:3866-5086
MTNRMPALLLLVALLFAEFVLANGFLPSAALVITTPTRRLTTHNSRLAEDTPDAIDRPVIAGVIAPLVYKGPYACLSLRFPNWNNAVWDFVVDTGANVNSIDKKLAEQNGMPQLQGIPQPLATSGVGGSFAPGELVLLGDCALAGLPPAQSHMLFLRNLTASALPHAGPTAGLLGSSFVGMFAGVEFDWYGTDGDPPTMGFYFGKSPLPLSVTQGMVRVPLQSGGLGLFIVSTTVNGVEIPALVDTGSPITILTKQAAETIGMQTVLSPTHDTGTFDNNRHHPRPRQRQQQAIGDPSLQVGGVDGRPMQLQRSESTANTIQVGSLTLGEGPVYIGNVPALSFLEQTAEWLQDKTRTMDPPVAILGLDFLRKAYRIIIVSASHNNNAASELWLDPMDDSKPKYKATN